MRRLRRRLTGALLLALASLLYHTVRQLPRGLACALGRGLGRLSTRLLRADARRTAEQLRRLPADRRPAVAEVFAHLGECGAEVCTMPRHAAGFDTFVTVAGRALFAERAAAPVGTVWVSGHVGNWELPAAWAAAQGLPISVIAARVHYPALDRFVRSLRQRHGIEVLRPGYRGLRTAVERLRAGGHVALLIDQRIPGRGTWVPFLGDPAWTPTGAVRIARAAGAPIGLGSCLRDGPGRRLLRFGPLFDVPPDADEATLTATLSRALEDVVRSHPEQWVWMHDRWSTPP